MPPSGGGSADIRFADGAPELEALINGVPQEICPEVSAPCYLQVDGQTVTTSFTYDALTQFRPFTAGAHSIVALNEQGYRVGPFKSPTLTAGNRYTLALAGSYPHYALLVFQEPAAVKGGGAQLSLYEASPAVPKADFGSFTASSRSHFKQLGSATLGSIATISLGGTVSNFGGYVGKGIKAFSKSALALAQVDTFDKKNVLPFHNASRLSLFLFDLKAGSGPVIGSLDR